MSCLILLFMNCFSPMLRGSGSRDALDILFVLDCPVVAVPDAIVVDDNNEDCLIDNDFLELYY